MHGDTSAARLPSTTASPIAECTATKATSSPVFVSQVPLYETAVVAVCAMAVIAATVIGPVHRVPRYLTPLADSAAVTTVAAQWRDKPP